jgi:hypothetical protein
MRIAILVIGNSRRSNYLNGFNLRYGNGGGSFAVHATQRGGTAGAANTGRGGSGCNRVAANVAGGGGGSGIIILRFIK